MWHQRPCQVLGNRYTCSPSFWIGNWRLSRMVLCTCACACVCEDVFQPLRAGWSEKQQSQFILIKGFQRRQDLTCQNPGWIVQQGPPQHCSLLHPEMYFCNIINKSDLGNAHIGTSLLSLSERREVGPGVRLSPSRQCVGSDTVESSQSS